MIVDHKEKKTTKKKLSRTMPNVPRTKMHFSRKQMVTQNDEKKKRKNEIKLLQHHKT